MSIREMQGDAVLLVGSDHVAARDDMGKGGLCGYALLLIASTFITPLLYAVLPMGQGDEIYFWQWIFLSDQAWRIVDLFAWTMRSAFAIPCPNLSLLCLGSLSLSLVFYAPLCAAVRYGIVNYSLLSQADIYIIDFASLGSILIWILFKLEREWAHAVQRMSEASTSAPTSLASTAQTFPEQSQAAFQAKASGTGDVCPLAGTPMDKELMKFYAPYLGFAVPWAVRDPFMLTRRPLSQWMFLLLSDVVMAMYFQFVLWFSDYFRALTSVGTFGYFKRQGSYIFFTAMCLLLKKMLKCLGYMIDEGKRGSTSYYFDGELLGSLWYSFFYRQLFSIFEKDTVLFYFLLAVHLGHGWAIGPCRATSVYYHLASRVSRVSPGGSNRLNMPLFMRALSGVSGICEGDWPRFVLMDYSIHMIVQMYSLIVYILGFLIVRFGPNGNHFLFYAQVDEATFLGIMKLSSYSLVFEFVNTVFILFWFKKRNLSLHRTGYYLFGNRKWQLMTSLTLNAIGCDVLMSQLKYNTISHVRWK